MILIPRIRISNTIFFLHENIQIHSKDQEINWSCFKQADHQPMGSDTGVTHTAAAYVQFDDVG